MRDINATENERYVIFSTQRPEILRATLAHHDIDHKVLSGQWQGEPEQSWIVNLNSFHVIQAHPEILASEECALHLGPMDHVQNGRPASLEYLGEDRPIENIGYLRAVSKEEAEASPGYTRDGQTYYVAS